MHKIEERVLLSYSMITKRNNKQEKFEEFKIANSLYNTFKWVEEINREKVNELTEKIIEKILKRRTEELNSFIEKCSTCEENNISNKDLYQKFNEYFATILTTNLIKDIIEEVLMEEKYFEVAKKFILYRKINDENNKRDIFKPRVNLKPYEYPELLEYVDAIRHSYWLHTEFNYTADIQDFKVNITPIERNAIQNTMLAIAQIEVAVKTFWWSVYSRLPKPEVSAVWDTFAESEVRHMDAYSHLLEILWLNWDFENLLNIPAIKWRIEYLDEYLKWAKTNTNRLYMRNILLFSLFIEHVSLFSQFLIIMAFNKYKNIFKWISNVVEATSKEEQIHWMFGIELINIIKKEHPEWFDEELNNMIKEACKKSFEAEKWIIDWIFEKWELEFLPKKTIYEFVKNRFNNSLESIWLEKIFEIDKEELNKTDWFDEEIMATKHLDFFVKRSVNYNKRSKSITSDDLF